MMVGRERGRGKGSREMAGKPVSGAGGSLALVCWRKKAKPLSEGMVLLLIHFVLVEKGSLAGFLSAVLNKFLLLRAFTALNVKISIAAHTPKVSEAVADCCPLAGSSLRCIAMILPKCTVAASGCDQALVVSWLGS